MEVERILKEMRQKMKNSVEHTLHEFSTLHTGKASPSMVDSLHVDAYGSSMRIKDVAAITTPDHRTISIQPWDKGMADPIAKAIQSANIGLNPKSNGTSILCPIPDLSKERRQELAKVASNMAEDGRVSIRSIRRDAMDALKKTQKAGAISEDDLKRHEKTVQQETDKAIGEVADHLKTKEGELMQV